jgi:tripeptide aminopeptidase
MYKKEQKSIVKDTLHGDFAVDFDLLMSIMYQQSPTTDLKKEAAKMKWLVELISKIDGVNVSHKDGNIYCTKGVAEYYPTVVAHYDTAQGYHKGLQIFKTDDWMFGFDNATGEQCGLGLDDAVGICFAIQMLKMMPVCKVFLPCGEERGLVGTNRCDMSFFDNSLVVTQLDRRSYTTDFIKFTNGVQVWNPDHLDLIKPLMKKYGYKTSDGTATDVGGLRRRGLKVSSHNLSCGYFNEHSDSEVASVSLMINAFSFAYEMLTMLAERNIPLDFPIPEYKPTTQRSYTDRYTDPFYWESEGRKSLDTPIYSSYQNYSDMIEDMYCEHNEPEIRKELTHFSNYYGTTHGGCKIDFLHQEAVDESIMDGICPVCMGHEIDVTNDLLIETICEDCESMFNVPVDRVDAIEKSFRKVHLGKMEFYKIRN